VVSAKVPSEFRGGLRQGLRNATWPLSSLRVDADTISIRTLTRLFQDIDIRLDETIGVRGERRLWSRGLRFDTASGRLANMVWWTPPGRHEEVVAALRDAGWPVATSSTR
jgi:hypothetical protein